MFRKSQISFFIIIAVILVSVTGFLYYNNISDKKDDLKTEDLSLDAETLNIKSQIDTCVEIVSNDAIYMIGFKGGQYKNSQYLFNLEEPINYFIVNQTIVKPKTEFIENEISEYIYDNLLNCTYKISNLNYNIQFSEPIIKTTINLYNVELNIKMESNVENIKNKEITSFKSFRYIANIPLGNILDYSDKILNSELENNFDYTNYHVDNYELMVSTYDSENKIYTIYENYSSLTHIPYIFNFAIYEKNNYPPSLDFIPDFVLDLNEEFNYYLNATDYEEDNLTYYSGDQLLNVNSATGELFFTPNEIKDYYFEVCVKDIHEDRDCKNILFMVMEQ